MPAESWTGGDVDCDVVVVGTGAGGAVVGHELAQRGHAVVFVEEGHLYHRHSFDGSSVRSARALLPARLCPGKRPLPGLRREDGGRLDGDQRRHRLPRLPPGSWSAGARRWAPTPSSPARMAPYFERVESSSRAWLPPRRGTWDRSPRSCSGDATPWAGSTATSTGTHRAARPPGSATSAAGATRAKHQRGLCPARRWRGGPALHRPQGRAGAERERARHRHRRERIERQPASGPCPGSHPRRGNHSHPAPLAQAEAGQLQPAGRTESHGSPQLSGLRALRRGDPRLRPHPPGLRLRAVPA